MADSPAVASRNPSKTVPSNTRRKRTHAEVDTIPASAYSRKNGITTTDPINLTDEPARPHKQARPTPRTLPMEPHAEVLAELKDKYSLITATVISSSKIEKKVTAVLAHIGRVDMFSMTSVPGVVMLHARAGEANKLVTVMELAKRRMTEVGYKWYQYNRVYEVAEERRGVNGKDSAKNNNKAASAGDPSQIVIDDKDEDEEDDEADAFEPAKTLNDLTIHDKPATESKNAYMSVFLSRVPMPELQTMPSFTLQTNIDQVGNRK